MYKRLITHTFMYCSMIILLTGCWDDIALEDRGFVTGVSVDKSEGETGDDDEITLTNQFVIPSKLEGDEGGGANEQQFTNFPVSGSSLFEIDQKTSSVTARQPFYEHMKVVIFSEELARERGVFESLLDGFIRDRKMRRTTNVFIAGEKASDILEIEPETDKSPAMYIDSLIESQEVNLEVTEPLKLGDLHSFVLNKDSYVIDHILPLENKRVQSDGVAVFSGYDDRLVGKLNRTETRGLNLITQNNTGGTINFDTEDYLMVYSLDNSSSTIKIDAIDQTNIEISVHIDTKGSIAEMFGGKSLLDEQHMEDIEKHINKRIEELVAQTIKKAQEELKVDFLGFSKKLRTNYYADWEKIKDHWDHGDNLFSKSDITVTASSEVLSIGPVDKVKEKKR